MLRVSAVIPTRGDVDLGVIAEHLRAYPEIVDIRFVKGKTPFNRYPALLSADTDICFSQDDDCLTDLQPLFDAYEPGVIVNAMTPEHAAQYPGRQTLIGFGGLFDRELVRSVTSLKWVRDPLFYRESDRIFATVNPHKTVFPKIDILPCASADNRLWKQSDHVSARQAMEQRIFEVTGIRA